jgi:protein ImuA
MLCAPDIDEKEGDTKAERIAALRRAVEGLQSIPARETPEHVTAAVGASLAPGLPGPGIVGGRLNEAVAAQIDRPAVFGFLFTLTAAALQARAGPAVFVAVRRTLDCGTPYGHGLSQLGVDVGRLILVETDTDKDALWALEEALRSEARPAMVTGAIENDLDLTQSRRLNLAAATHATPLVLSRGGKAAGNSAAATRWRIAPAPAALDRFDTFACWRWQVTLERCRNGRTGAWLIEWDPVTRRFRSVGELTDRASVDIAVELTVTLSQPFRGSAFHLPANPATIVETL